MSDVKKTPGFTHPDISYRALWRKSGRLLAALVEETVYLRDHDGCLKVAIKARKVPEECLTYERFQDRITEVLDALAEEKKQDEKDIEAEQASATESGKAGEAGSGTGSSIAAGSNAELIEEANWQKTAERKFMSHIFLIPEPASETALATAIQATPLSKINGTPGKQYVVIHYDQKLSGECTSKPSFRYPPLADDKYMKLMKSALKSRNHGDESEVKDMPCRGFQQLLPRCCCCCCCCLLLLPLLPAAAAAADAAVAAAASAGTGARVD
jgi:hypothetical protein